VEERTIPFPVSARVNDTTVTIRPLPRGSGIVACDMLHFILHNLGVRDASAKIHKHENMFTVVKAIFKCFDNIRGQQARERALGRKLISLDSVLAARKAERYYK
jgi:ribosomal protein S5